MFSPIGEIYIQFDKGKIDGEISGVSPLELADAFRRIAYFIETDTFNEIDSVSYIDFDEGKFSAG